MGTYFLDALYHMWNSVCHVRIYSSLCVLLFITSGSSPARVLTKRPLSTEEGVLSPVSQSPPSKVSVLNICVMCEHRISCGGKLAYVLYVLKYVEIVFNLCGV